MAHCTKQSTTYKRDFDLGQDVIVKIGLTLPFTLTEAQVGVILGQLVDAIDDARFATLPTQTRLFERDGVTATLTGTGPLGDAIAASAGGQGDGRHGH